MIFLSITLLAMVGARSVSSKSQKKCTAESCDELCKGAHLEWTSQFYKRGGMYRRNRCICEVSRKYDESIPGVAFIRKFLEKFPWSRVWYECIDNAWFIEPQYHA